MICMVCLNYLKSLISKPLYYCITFTADVVRMRMGQRNSKTTRHLKQPTFLVQAAAGLVRRQSRRTIQSLVDRCRVQRLTSNGVSLEKLGYIEC